MQTSTTPTIYQQLNKLLDDKVISPEQFTSLTEALKAYRQTLLSFSQLEMEEKQANQQQIKIVYVDKIVEPKPAIGMQLTTLNIDEIIKTVIAIALEKHHTKREAAIATGMSERTFYRYLLGKDEPAPRNNRSGHLTKKVKNVAEPFSENNI